VDYKLVILHQSAQSAGILLFPFPLIPLIITDRETKRAGLFTIQLSLNNFIYLLIKQFVVVCFKWFFVNEIEQSESAYIIEIVPVVL
jgi:hypothetical protein